MSISGVQEKFSVLLEKNKLRLVKEEERGTPIVPHPADYYLSQMSRKYKIRDHRIRILFQQ